jgi:hypothetical protein
MGVWIRVVGWIEAEGLSNSFLEEMTAWTDLMVFGEVLGHLDHVIAGASQEGLQSYGSVTHRECFVVVVRQNSCSSNEMFN